MSTSIAIVPRCEISIRPATAADIPFMDSLQKQHGKALGYFPTKQFEGYLEMGGVLVAWATRPCSSDGKDTGESPVPLGYIISRDRYLKRDELGVIYQLCVAPAAQRKLIGAMLVREVFARSAYGCRLYCCWCAQDLDANYFWESMGFLPIAFRAGSTGKRRVHIFWQRRIVEGDSITPFWFPSQTNQGAIREDRLVFPIPPGVHWKDVKAVEVAQVARATRPCLQDEKKNTGGSPVPHKTPKPQPMPRRRVQFGPPPAAMNEEAEVVAVSIGKPKRAKKPARAKVKNDPAHVAAARELRDRYLERFNTGGAGTVLPNAKYAVGRALPAPAPAPSRPQSHQLPQAA